MKRALQNLTFTKLLTLAAALLIAWSGLCCEWFRSISNKLCLRHPHLRPFHEASNDAPQQQSEKAYLRTRRYRDGKLAHDNATNANEVGNSKPSDKEETNDSSSGFWFSKSLGDRSQYNDSNSVIQFQVDSEHCQGNGLHGNIQCHYDWGDILTLNYTLQMPLFDDTTSTTKNDENSNGFGKGAYIKGSFTVNDNLSWTLRCDICGKDCKLDGFLQNLDLSFIMPDCPNASSNNDPMEGSLSFPFWSQSPTKSKGPLTLKGEVEIYSHSNELLGQLAMDATR